MDKISISNIFSENNNEFKPLDVYSLYDRRININENKINLNIDKLLKSKEERKNKLYQQYDKIFNICLNKINTANILNKHELIYNVPDGIFGYFDYDASECLMHIENKLKELELYTLIIDNKTIYINWEELIEKKRKRKIKNN